MSNKVKAFTIMEVVIVMLLSAIVISIAFKAFDILSHNYIQFKEKQEEFGRLALLDRLLTMDLLRNSRCRVTEEGLIFQSTSENVNYTFLKNALIRQQLSQSDTFKITVSEVRYLYAGKELAGEGALVDELSFINTYEEEKQTFHYTKNYSAEIRMQHELQKHNRVWE